MPRQNVDLIGKLFHSRLETLEHLMQTAQNHFNDESFLQNRIATDMFPFCSQIAFTCNQPRNFALWCDGKPADNLDPNVTSVKQAYEYIASTKQLLADIDIEDKKLTEVSRIDLGQNLYLELSGNDYVNEFLMPNFYFHLVTAYDILRMAGVSIGKRDYMLHLVPFLQKE